MVLVAIRPYKGDEMWLRFSQTKALSYIDNAAKYHEKCYNKKIIQGKKDLE